LLSKNTNIKIYRSIILFVLYGCETWSVTLREEHRLRVFENRVLRGMFGPKRDEVTGEWRRLHNVYSLPVTIRAIKSRRTRWVGHAARMGRKKNVYRDLAGKPEDRRRRGRCRCRWEGNIKMDLKDAALEGVNWLDMLHVDCCEHGDEPTGSIRQGQVLGELREYSKRTAPWEQSGVPTYRYRLQPMEPRVQKGFLVLTHGMSKHLMEVIPTGIFNPVKYSGYYMYQQFNIHKFYVLPTQCIYVFCVDLRTNSDYFTVQH
jgi:hypothetical protein